ncbi:dihydroxyacetone kinase DhaL subunit [Micromonospora matsumotoense]|uniref:Dihydroxyacetone kinase DhaL subunit n=1 Tax=Micromonospora matsumotoense TaxID=121616 RepID=A0A1C4ZQ52_9ACTN|nr:dihydroxyacetone kinase subunit DhaL [Micromonospora matsumotoense]SCF35170.1 dihydroxyacetone kinase DhaL subunit [Micromonospora matsumotoense]
MDINLARAWVHTIAGAVAEQKDRLTWLDSAIGDADHGTNMHRGFTAASAALDGLVPDTVGAVLIGTGTMLLSFVGGASGPLFGGAFRAVGQTIYTPAATTQELAEALAAGLAEVTQIGAAVPGDKTVVDAWTPALAAFRHRADAGADLAEAALAAADAAEEGMRATAPLQARRGRASYLGTRSIGQLDPGAASTALIFRALADAVTAR